MVENLLRLFGYGWTYLHRWTDFADFVIVLVLFAFELSKFVFEQEVGSDLLGFGKAIRLVRISLTISKAYLALVSIYFKRMELLSGQANMPRVKWTVAPGKRYAAFLSHAKAGMTRTVTDHKGRVGDRWFPSERASVWPLSECTCAWLCGRWSGGHAPPALPAASHAGGRRLLRLSRSSCAT